MQFYRGAPAQDSRPHRKVKPSKGGGAALAKGEYRRQLVVAAWVIVRPDEHTQTRYLRYSGIADRQAAVQATGGWGIMLEAGLRLFISQPEWPIAQAIIRWMRENPVGSQRALQQLWLGRAPANLREFDTSLPRERFPHPIVRRAVVLMLGIIQSDRLVGEVRASANIKPPNIANKPGQTTVPHSEPSSTGEPRQNRPDEGDEAQKPAAVAKIHHGSHLASQQLGVGPVQTRSASSHTPHATSTQQSWGNAKTTTSVNAIGIARIVALEAHLIQTFHVTSDAAELDAERREAALVHRYAQWLAQQNVHVVRHELMVTGHARPLYTDLYDLSRAELVEAKASTERSDVRMALGQLLDYMRYVDHSSLAVLTPTPISRELLELLSRHRIGNIYETLDGSFDRAFL